ncbi:hypothetical protein [Devosia sp. FKR38]|uniref:hypothetical protein n=1 Tax=Devosia sp. FKR38 TaxID=2562312 RepID=UPI0010C08B64|nr:hypothetical protein [Devosia sp. FKR38]
MIVVAKPPTDFLNRLTWAVFWRWGILGLILPWLLGFAIGFVLDFGYHFLSMFFTKGRPDFENTPQAVITFSQVLAGVGGLVVNFFILRWAIRSQLGKVAVQHTLVVAAVNTDKELQNAN